MTDLRKYNGNPVDEYSFRIIDGHFYEGETVTVQTVLDNKIYMRKVWNDRWDLYIMINRAKCYYSDDRVEDYKEPEFINTREKAILGIGDDYGFDEYDI